MRTKTRAGTIAAVAVLLGLCGALIPRASAEPTNFFVCTPYSVASFAERVHVSCSPTDGAIAYFAVCSKDPAAAARALSLFATADVAGKHLGIYYNPADTSGTSCGCLVSDCRVIQGVDLRP